MNRNRRINLRELIIQEVHIKREKDADYLTVTIVFQAKDKYDAALAELDRLQQKKNEIQNKELIKAIEKSGRSFDEIMAFLKDGQE